MERKRDEFVKNKRENRTNSHTTVKREIKKDVKKDLNKENKPAFRINRKHKNFWTYF